MKKKFLLSVCIMLLISVIACSDTSSTPQLNNNTTDNGSGNNGENGNTDNNTNNGENNNGENNGGENNGGDNNTDSNTDIVGNSEFMKKTQEQICSTEYGDTEGCSEGLKYVGPYYHTKKDPELAIYVLDYDKMFANIPNGDWKNVNIPVSHQIAHGEYNPDMFKQQYYILLYKLKMQDLGNGKNKITVIKDLRAQNNATGFDLKIDENVKYHYADGKEDIFNGITVNKGYIKDNPSYFNDKYKICPIIELPKELYQTKAGLCNNEGEGCFDRLTVLFSTSFTTSQMQSIIFGAFNQNNFMNNRQYKGIGIRLDTAPNFIPLYKVEKITQGDSYDYKVTDLKTNDMTGFEYKIIKDVRQSAIINNQCGEFTYDYIIIEKGNINNIN